MVTDRPLSHFLALIQNRTPFTLSRWGDPEWATLLGEKAGQVPPDGYGYFPRLCRTLAGVLDRDPAYFLGLAHSPAGRDKAETVILDCGYAQLTWVAPGYLPTDPAPLLDAVNQVPLVVVGQPNLRRVRDQLRFGRFVDVPPRNAYLSRKEILGNVMAALEKFNRPVTVTLSAGVVGPILADALHKRVGHWHQVIDVGDLWDQLRPSGLTGSGR